MIIKKEEEVCKVYLARCCDGGFTPALSTSWQVWTKTSVGGVFTISLLMVRRLTEVTNMLHNIALCLSWYFANFATWPLCFKRARLT